MTPSGSVRKKMFKWHFHFSEISPVDLDNDDADTGAARQSVMVDQEVTIFLSYKCIMASTTTEVMVVPRNAVYYGIQSDIGGLVQDRRNSIANALVLRLSWTNPINMMYPSDIDCHMDLLFQSQSTPGTINPSFVCVIIYYT